MKTSLSSCLIITFFLPSCAGKRDDLTKPTTDTDSTTTTVDHESVSNPTIITGTYLACEYTAKPTSDKPMAEIGCRVAVQSTGRKYDMSKAGNYEWGYEDPKVATVAMQNVTDATSPWHVLYQVSGSYDKVSSIGALFKVGVKDKGSGQCYYTPVNSLVGKLAVLMEGDWKSNLCLKYDTTHYYMRTDHMKTGTYSTTMAYYANTTCTDPPAWTEEIIGLFTNVAFNGIYFLTDARTDSYLYKISTAEAVTLLKGLCPNINFTVDTTIEGVSCLSSNMEYSTMQIDEGKERIYTAISDSDSDGNTADKRKKLIDTTWYLQKQ